MRSAGKEAAEHHIMLMSISETASFVSGLRLRGDFGAGEDVNALGVGVQLANIDQAPALDHVANCAFGAFQDLRGFRGGNVICFHVRNYRQVGKFCQWGKPSVAAGGEGGWG